MNTKNFKEKFVIFLKFSGGGFSPLNPSPPGYAFDTAQLRVRSNSITLPNFASGFGRVLRKTTGYFKRLSKMIACQEHKPEDDTRRD